VVVLAEPHACALASVCYCEDGAARAPPFLHAEGGRHAREAEDRVHQHGLAVPTRGHVTAIVVRPVVVIAAQDDLDEGRVDREVHRALGGRVGALREVELHLAHFWLVSVRYGFPAES